MSRRKKKVRRGVVSQGKRSKSSPCRDVGCVKPERIILSGRKLWAFRLIGLVVFPILVLVAIELVLRWGGYGFCASAVVRQDVGDVEFLVSNNSFGQLFFPPKLARQFDPFVIGVDKGDNLCRIVVLGASAVQGVPDGAYSFSRMLKVMLEERYPSVEFEVFNAGMTAINSHGVVQIMRDLQGCDADVFVVYLGNNEVVGPYGAGTVFSPLKSNLSVIRAGIALRRYRLGQLISSFGGGRGDQNLDHWRGMEMYLEHQVSAGDPRLETVYGHFRKNLEDICSIANRRGAKVVLCTVASNLRDCAPFVSVHGDGLDAEGMARWESIYAEGVRLEDEGDCKGALEKYLSCEEIDDQFADLHFRMGRMYDRSEAFDKARVHYIKARELDTLRFRADNRINGIIRDVASGNEDVFLADAVEACARASDNEICGGRLFYEHVHMTFTGNLVVGRAVLEGIEKAFVGQLAAARVEDVQLSVEVLKDRLAFTPIDEFISKEVMLEVYLKKPPFTNQLYHDQQTALSGEEVDKLRKSITKEVVDQAALTYRKAIESWRKDWWLRWKYAELLVERQKKINEAIKECREVLEIVPQYGKCHIQLAHLQVKTGNFSSARKHYLIALQLNENEIDAAYGLSILSEKEGRPAEALEWYRRTLSIDVRHRGAILNLGNVLSELGKNDEAIEVYLKGVELFENDVDLHYNLAILYYLTGAKSEAVRYMRKAQKLDPESAEIGRKLEAMERK